MRSDLPSGTVTFLFTDVEGSTKLLEEIGDEAYDAALAEHRRIVRTACEVEGGVEVDTQGDAFFFAFPTVPGALAAAAAMTSALASGSIKVRIGLHTGKPRLSEEGYVGKEVHFAARVAATGHGGQIVLSKATRDLLDGLDLTDLGEHRLKDIQEPVSIYQLGTASFPPLKTISNTNLPRPASSFVGRELELGEVLGKIAVGARLLTLTGPGGSGKTRLALEAAASLVPEYKAGVFWIGLAALHDPALVSEQIGQTLGAKDGVAEHIGERELLLLLDNLEQVIEAAPELSALLQSCPNLTLLCTSRELLRVQGEVEYEVPPLASPEAVLLFCERAQLEPSDDIAELCARLDNLPLAVELAAARTKALSPAQILERLSQRLDLLKGGRDADPRQQTLRATIAWSYDLLSEDEQRLFRSLSVFAGGCTLEAAEEVADADLDTLQSLVEKSLLRFTSERHWMLETIREYAAERLEESGDSEQLRLRHAEAFLALAEEAVPHLRSADPSGWLDRLGAEHDNLRATLDEFEARGESQLALRLAGSLGNFWYLREHAVEGRLRLDRALGADDRPTAARAKALNAASIMAQACGDAAAGNQFATQALTLHRQLGDARGVAVSTHLLGHVAVDLSDWATAQRLFDESVRAFRELGDENFVLLTADILAYVHYRLGDRTRALALVEDNLRQARAMQNRRMEATSLGQLGLYAVEDGRVEDAVWPLVESTRIWREVGWEFDEVGLNLCSIARVLAVAGRAEAATRLISAAMHWHDEIGAAPRIYTAELNEKTLTIIHGDLDESAFAEAWEQGATMTPDEAVEYALASID